MVTTKTGLLTPFRRDLKKDFAHSAGRVDLLESRILNVLQTEAQSDVTNGELPWNPGFGSLLHITRHRQNNTALQQLIQAYVIEALRRHLPEIRIDSVGFRREKTITAGDSLRASIAWTLVDPVSGNVLQSNLTTQLVI